jgi:hypothetical protein
MSAVSDIEGYLNTKIVELLPTIKPLPYMYLQDENTTLADHSYAVKVGKARSSSGVNNYVTLDHEFTVDFSKRYSPKKGSGDTEARNKALEVYGEVETVYKALAKRSMSFTSCSVLLISPLDVSEPTIDNDNNLVTVTLTLDVKYRVAT